MVIFPFDEDPGGRPAPRRFKRCGVSHTAGSPLCKEFRAVTKLAAEFARPREQGEILPMRATAFARYKACCLGPARFSAARRGSIRTEEPTCPRPQRFRHAPPATPRHPVASMPAR